MKKNIFSFIFLILPLALVFPLVGNALTPHPTKQSQLSDVLFEINQSKFEYYKNPNGFREELINNIISYTGAPLVMVATEVYRNLPDVKN